MGTGPPSSASPSQVAASGRIVQLRFSLAGHVYPEHDEQPVVAELGLRNDLDALYTVLLRRKPPAGSEEDW